MTSADPWDLDQYDIFGCWFCGGMGYRDYPSNKEPCPIPGHVRRAEENVRLAATLLDQQRRPYTPQEGNCPYCLAAGDPVGVSCKHWNGLGWTRDRE